ncbi:MAG TPA: glycosyltransferase family 39 protein [Gemmatimonadaceae bacterium]|nr:glycosyltransferase family 39 protein [Gemmatimonadaceae bacterium]
MLQLKTREAALIIAIVSSLAIWWVWAAIDPLPLIEDEYSYVLQSRIFAEGHWTAPPPPAPTQLFFQQAHVIDSPAVASKFPPGHALLMSVGSFFGAPALVPLLLTGITAALIFLLVRRVANAWVAVLAWIIWLGDPINLRFRAAYYSEVTSGAMWMIALWALLEWRESRRRKWLFALAAAIGWGAITRPLTMLAFAVPVGILVIRDVIRTKLWRDFGMAAALGTMILGVIPLWSARTTGNWRLSPLTLYQRDYLPYDKPGFGVDMTQPALPLMPVNRFTYIGFFAEHKFHTPANLPKIAAQRLWAIAVAEWGGPRLILVPFVLLGLLSIGGATRFALLCSFALFVGYLSYGHWKEWTLYYFEAMPPLSLLAALGLWRALTWTRGKWTSLTATLDLRPPARPSVAVAALLIVLTGNELRLWHDERVEMAAWDIAFHQMLTQLPVRSAVLFVHYAPRVGPHSLVVGVSPHVMRDSIWIVNDLGADDTTLMRYAGSRVPLLFHEDGGQVEIDRALLPHAPR